MIWIIFSIIIQGIFCYDVDTLANIAKELSLKPPINIQSDRNLQVQTTKHLLGVGMLIKTENVNHICGVEVDQKFQMIFQDSQSSIMIVMQHGTSMNDVMSEMKCQINQEVYFLNQNLTEVFETYTINNITVVQRIAYVEKQKKLSWLKDRHVISRRNDFKGIHLKAMVEQDGIWTKVRKTFATDAMFHQSNQTWDVSQYVSGVVIDILNIMMSEYNFTTSYHLRKDRKWGTVIQYSNGSYKAIGVVGDIFLNRSDIFAAYPRMGIERIEVLDYLWPKFSTGL